MTREQEGPTQENNLGEIDHPRLIEDEQKALYRDLRFFTHHDYQGSEEILTTTDLVFITGTYPALVKEILSIYNQLATPNKPQSAQETFINAYLAGSLQKGEVVTNDQANSIRIETEAGKYSQQVDAHVWQLHNLDRQKQDRLRQEDDEPNSIEAYPKIETHRSINYRKGKVLSLMLSLEDALRTAYGEIDYKTALVTEFLLQAPFLALVVSKESTDDIDDTAKQRHLQYLEEIVDFAQVFDPVKRFQEFKDLTKVHDSDPITEVNPQGISEFDLIYLDKLYGFAKRLKEGDFAIEDLYSLLRQTLFRREKHFVTKKSGYGFAIHAVHPDVVSFSDIAAYARQTNYFKTLVQRIDEKDPAINDIRLVLLASRPGLGKSLAVKAFLNELPQNGRGVLFDHQQVKSNDVETAYKELVRLADLHPDLHVFVAVEDIDRNEAIKGAFLEIESVIPGTLPTNLHFIVTTNAPKSIPDAILRPGRTSEILIYQPPKKKRDRKEIVRLHAQKRNIHLADKVMKVIANRTRGFTPDEIVHVIRTLELERIENPTNADIKRITSKIKDRRGLAKKRL